jgi:hypothetical protein
MEKERFQVEHEPDTGDLRCNFFQQFQPFSADARLQIGKACNARTGQTLNETSGYGLAYDCEYNRNAGSRLIESTQSRCSVGYDYMACSLTGPTVPRRDMFCRRTGHTFTFFSSLRFSYFNNRVTVGHASWNGEVRHTNTGPRLII